MSVMKRKMLEQVENTLGSSSEESNQKPIYQQVKFPKTYQVFFAGIVCM